MVRLFDGDISFTEIMSMDIPASRAMIQARLENLRRSQEQYSQGILDAYSRRYASTMFSGPSRTLSSPEDQPSNQNQQHDEIDRSHSRNIHDMWRQK